MTRRELPPLGLLVFVVGAASLGAEISAARLLAPYFGASTIVWANTIGIVLVSLAVGYWVGGRFADRHPQRRSLCLMALVAALLLGLVPFLANPFLDASVKAFDELSIGAFLGSLIGVTALVSVPVMLLGAASPWAIRLAVGSVEESGTVSGRMYAISTAGSLVGTFASALLLIPLVGTRRTFLTFALLLALAAAVGLPRRALLVPLALALLVALPVGTIKASGDGVRVLYERETPYQYARVVEHSDGERALELNEGQVVHSVFRPGRYLTGGYWDGMLVLPFATRTRPPGRIAILGNAGGTTARAYGHFFPHTRVDGVEIDGDLTTIGRRYLGLRNPRMRVFAQDARPYLRATPERYDVIVVDAYRQPYIPFYLSTKEFFRLARQRLRPGGVVIINVGHPETSDRLESALTATMGAAFPTVLRYPIRPESTLLVGTAAPGATLRSARAALRRAGTRLPPALEPLALAAADRLAGPLRGGPVYTDDRAPVEWLIDRSIVQYAAESGR